MLKMFVYVANYYNIHCTCMYVYIHSNMCNVVRVVYIAIVVK